MGQPFPGSASLLAEVLALLGVPEGLLELALRVELLDADESGPHLITDGHQRGADCRDRLERPTRSGDFFDCVVDRLGICFQLAGEGVESLSCLLADSVSGVPRPLRSLSSLSVAFVTSA